jgi:membrane protein
MKRFLSVLPNLLKLTYQGWKADKASRLAAALAYYTIFSLAPMLVIVIAVAGLIWQRDAVQSAVMQQIGGLVGPQGADFVGSLLDSASNPTQGIIATIFGIVTLLFGALGVFNALHESLNAIWEVKEKETKGIWNSIKKVIVDRFLSFTMILGIGFILIVSLVISAGITALGTWFGGLFPFSEIILQIINLVISLIVITAFFALIFKVLPDADIAWRDVGIGAFFTAVLFSIGKTLIGLYIGSSAVTSSFGAAGSLVLLLLWIYYSAQILFFGAEFTQVYANQLGSRIVPEGQASKTRSIPATYAQGTTKGAGRAIIPVTSGPSYELNPKIERENQQTARLIASLMGISFVTGIITTIFGLKNKR